MNATLRVGVLVALLMLLVPVLVAPMPPLLDYPNHFARLWLLSGGIEADPFPSIYAIDWQRAGSNIAIDLIAFVFGPIFGIETVARVLIALAVVLPPAGAIALSRRLHGGWHWWQVAMTLAAFSPTLLAGFLNFQIGVGIALLLGTAEARPCEAGRAGRYAFRILTAITLPIFHIFALILYALILGALAFGYEKPGSGGTRNFFLRLWRAAYTAIIPVSICFIMQFLLLPSSPVGDEQVVNLLYHPKLSDYDPVRKLFLIISSVVVYDLQLDLAVAALVCIGLGAASIDGASVRATRVHHGVLLAAVGVVVVTIIAPAGLLGTSWIDQRLPPLALLLFMASLKPAELRPIGKLPASIVFGAVALALSVGRSAQVASIWHQRQDDVASVLRAVQAVPPGATLLAFEAEHRQVEQPPGRMFFLGSTRSYSHIVSLAVPAARAFVPTIFAEQGKQPLRVQAPWRSSSMPVGGYFLMRTLAEPDPPSVHVAIAPVVAFWRDRLDYVLELNADLPPPQGWRLALPELTLIADEGFARLYRVDRSALPRPGPP